MDDVIKGISFELTLKDRASAGLNKNEKLQDKISKKEIKNFKTRKKIEDREQKKTDRIEKVDRIKKKVAFRQEARERLLRGRAINKERQQERQYIKRKAMTRGERLSGGIRRGVDRGKDTFRGGQNKFYAGMAVIGAAMASLQVYIGRLEESLNADIILTQRELNYRKTLGAKNKDGVTGTLLNKHDTSKFISQLSSQGGNVDNVTSKSKIWEQFANDMGLSSVNELSSNTIGTKGKLKDDKNLTQVLKNLFDDFNSTGDVFSKEPQFDIITEYLKRKGYDGTKLDKDGEILAGFNKQRENIDDDRLKRKQAQSKGTDRRSKIRSVENGKERLLKLSDKGAQTLLDGAITLLEAGNVIKEYFGNKGDKTNKYLKEILPKEEEERKKNKIKYGRYATDADVKRWNLKEKKASGGNVMAGNPYQVNEKGKEMFVPKEDGLIVPAGKTNSLLQGGSNSGQSIVINNLTIQSNSPKEFLDRLNSLAKTSLSYDAGLGVQN